MTSAPVTITLPPLSEGQQNAPWENIDLEDIPDTRIYITMKNDAGKQPESTIRTTNKQYFSGIYHHDYVLESKPQAVSLGTTVSTASQSGGLVVVIARNSTNLPFISMIKACKGSGEKVSVAIIDQTEKTASSNALAVYGFITQSGSKRNGKVFFFRVQIHGLVDIDRPIYAEPGKVETAKGNLVNLTYNCSDQDSSGKPPLDKLLLKFAQDSIKALK